MKILVISDTHGDISKAEKAIRANKDIGLIIHLGDYYRDAIKLSKIFQDIPVEYVYGNSDFMIEDAQAEKLLDICGKKVFITHGHRYSVKWDYEKLFKRAQELHADIALFGHTHSPVIASMDQCLILNPGSTSDPREDSDESYAIVEIEDSRINPRIYLI